MDAVPAFSAQVKRIPPVRITATARVRGTLYRSLGWQLAGVIPACARPDRRPVHPDGRACARTRVHRLAGPQRPSTAHDRRVVIDERPPLRYNGGMPDEPEGKLPSRDSNIITRTQRLIPGIRYNWDYDDKTDVLRIRLKGPHKAIKEGESVEMVIAQIFETLQRADNLRDSN